MASNCQSFIDYVSLLKHDNGNVTLDEQKLTSIREKFTGLHNGDNIDDKDFRHGTVRNLMKELRITDDTTSFEYVDLIVQQTNDYGARIEVLAKFRSPVEYPDSAATNGKKNKKKIPTSKPIIESQPDAADDIICIIQKKCQRKEIDDFIRTFLFKQVQPSNQPSTSPVFDGKSHSLPRGTLIDLFIRQQMMDRGMITFIHPQSRFRLVESISLTDEFESWTFDHFHNLLNFWLTIDLTNKKKFPNQWKLDPQAKIKYAIVQRLADDNNDQTSKHLERPSTKSLENFIRDICQIEGNGMSNTWYEVLSKKENINTYAHLTNLNQKEWDRIRSLPMNALKTIKFYIDREKQMVEERKTKKTEDPDQKQEISYSEAELCANLHMIKLFFLRQLEDQDGIETIPRLDAYCVETAFDEMRDEGYKDDGLFDEMKLFFQPLTVTESELIINPTLLTKLREAEKTEKTELERIIDNLNHRSTAIQDLLDRTNAGFVALKKVRDVEFQAESSGNTERTYQKQIEIYLLWKKKNEEWREREASYIKEIEKLENKLKYIEAQMMEKQNQLETIEKNSDTQNTKIDRRLVKPHRGFIMYGPPGTGKSVIMSKLAKKIGIAMLGPPLAAGELERPLVGQSEAVILDLCMRGNRLPHLMCCVSIDEIDSLAPRRDEDSSEGKVAKISVLLSVIEGIKDVPNLMFFSATNRLHMMDEAFLRRMSGKFFVGRPSSDARKQILDDIPNTILTPAIRQKLATATTNFSGAALKALTSAITVHYLAKRRGNADYEIQEDDTLILADRTARQYQLFLGLDTLPRLILQNLNDRRQLSVNADEPAGLHLPKTATFTGKIIISLPDEMVRIEIIKKNQPSVFEATLGKTERSLQQLLERITSYGNDRNVQLLQLIDLNLLSSKGAHDEKKIFETLKERYDECMEYKRSMIVYDLDSLIGVNKSESESSMGISTSSSVVNQSIYVYVTSRFREAKIESSQSVEKLTIERWAIAVTRDPFLLKKFTSDVAFTLTVQQREQEEEEEHRSKTILVCAKCRDNFIETENKMGACTYHDGFVYDNLAPGLDKCTPSRAIQELNKEEAIAFTDQTRKEEMDKKNRRFRYICCSAILQVGGGLHGCKKGRHGLDKSENKSQEILSTKKMIEIWEALCLDNHGYNEQFADLIESRNTQFEAERIN
ncbi:unnamed protein product [Adineta steineri]|uniref:AAA+ ATPase domain-containing protein n=1 Tax=Adineta steineri TaxID=433720 RepID=A0A815M7W0_9BILA|nr:unnamed protein product [Adineta steineri]CAF3991269.1 unnamed protein product [Adineta steineri]